MNGPEYSYGVALVRTILQDEGFKTLCPSGVFDGEKPQDMAAVVPYLVIEGYTTMPDDTLNHEGVRIGVTICADDFSRSNKVLMLISGRLRTLLHRKPDTLTANAPSGWVFWENIITSANVMEVDSTQGSRRLVVRMEARMQLSCQP